MIVSGTSTQAFSLAPSPATLSTLNENHAQPLPSVTDRLSPLTLATARSSSTIGIASLLACPSTRHVAASRSTTDSLRSKLSSVSCSAASVNAALAAPAPNVTAYAVAP